uniref:IS66 family insertion sequence element accessory protein TnpA n=1 Tax=Massilia sp. W12 TaxID=3126507 RepID=UPI00403FAF8E
MQSKSPKKSREEWLAHVRAWRMSGQTQSAYCRQHEINLPVLQYWIKRSRSGSECAPLTLVAAQAPTGAISAPISGNLTLECGAQRLHIPLHVPAQWLAALLRELA